MCEAQGNFREEEKDDAEAQRKAGAILMNRPVELEGRKYTAYESELGNLKLVVIKAKRGYIACSYIDKETAEKVGDIAGFVSGVKCVDDMLKAKLRSTTSWAEDIGLREGMSVKKALEILDSDEED